MRIGELARKAGINASKVRFYEASGLLPSVARSANGYRDYDEHALQVVMFVKLAQSFGFSLREVTAHLRAPEKGAARKARLHARLVSKLAELDAHMEAMRARRAALHELIEEVHRAHAAEMR